MCFATFSPKIPKEYEDSEYLFLANIDPVLQARVRSQMPNVKMVCGDTMNYWIADHRAALNEVLKVLDVLLINDGEAKMLSGETNLVRAAEAVIEQGPKTLVIKHGEYGATVFFGPQSFVDANSRPFRAPALPLAEVVDPTGAGASFAGGFYGYIASQPKLTPAVFRTALFYGGVMGSFAVERFGTERLQVLTREEIEARFRAVRGDIASWRHGGVARRELIAADPDAIRPATREETLPLGLAAVVAGMISLSVCRAAPVPAAVWRCRRSPRHCAANHRHEYAGAGAAWRSVAAAAASADAAVYRQHAVVAGWHGGGVAFADLLCGCGDGDVPAGAAADGSALGAGSDGVLWVECESAVSGHDGDD